MALKLDILANTREFVSSMRKAGASVEDIGDELDDMAREGDQATEKLERSFKEMARSADSAGDKVGTGLRGGFRKAGEGADEFKREANSSMRETAASISSVEDGLDAVQEIAANAFAGFGPAGAVAGLAAAAGIGLVVAGFDAAGEAAEANEERVAEWADAYIEAGGKALTAGVMAARAQAIITDPALWKEAEENAKNWGVNIETALSAMTGNQGAIDTVSRSVRDMGEALESIPDEQAFTVGIQMEQAYNRANDSLKKLNEEMGQGQTRAQVLNGYYEDLINSAGGATVEVDELGNRLYTLPDETQVLVNAETGQATTNVEAFKGDVDEIPEKVTTRVKFEADTSSVDNYMTNLQRRAATGVTVNVRAGQGRLWE